MSLPNLSPMLSYVTDTCLFTSFGSPLEIPSAPAAVPKKTRGSTKRMLACQPCRSQHLKCVGTRPCLRCICHRMESCCVDPAKPPRKTSKRKQATEIQNQSLSYGVSLETSFSDATHFNQTLEEFLQWTPPLASQKDMNQAGVSSASLDFPSPIETPKSTAAVNATFLSPLTSDQWLDTNTALSPPSLHLDGGSQRNEVLFNSFEQTCSAFGSTGADVSMLNMLTNASTFSGDNNQSGFWLNEDSQTNSNDVDYNSDCIIDTAKYSQARS